VTLTDAQRVVRRRWALLLSIAATALGALVLIGWTLEIAVLKGIRASGVTMKPNTACGFLLCGLALAFLSTARPGARARWFAAAAGSVVIALTTLALGESFFGWNLGIDQWLFREAPGAVQSVRPGRMSPQAAFCLLLMGIALVLASRRPLGQVRLAAISALSVAIILIGGLAVVGLVSFEGFGIHFWNYAGLAPHTTVGLACLGCALLAWARSGGGLAWTLDAKVTAGFVVGVLSILGAAGISYRFTNQLRDSAQWVSHTQEVLKEIEELSASQRDLTLSLGRYLITHDETAIAQRTGIKLAIQEDIDHVRSLTADNPRQQIRIRDIEALTLKRVALSDRIIAAVQQHATAGGSHASTPSTSPNAGSDGPSPLGTEYPAVGQEIDHVLQGMEAEEYSLLSKRRARSDANSTQLFLLMPVGVYLSLVVLLLAMYLLNTRVATQKLAEDARNELETYFRAIFEVTPDGIIVTDSGRTIVMANPAAERMFDYRAGELTGVRIESLVPDTLQADLARERMTLLESTTATSVGNIWRAEGIRKDGSRFPIEILRSAFSTSHGPLILGVARDLTERIHVEETRSRMAAIVESSDDAIIGKDLDGIVSSWNKGAARIFGYSAQEMIGQSVLRIVPPERAPEEQAILSHIAQGQSIEHSETIRQTKDGRLIDVSISVSPIRDISGKVIGASKIARDITASKHLELQLRQSQKMEAIGQLTGGVAHDFNNLLGVVLGNLDLLERLVAGNEPALKRVQNAQKAALRGANLTRRMLAFSSRQPLHAAPTSVVESVDNMIEMATRTIGPEITLSSKLDPSVPPIMVDAAGLENALLNLVVNARDAMPAGGSIVISSQVRDIAAAPTAEAEELSPGRYLCLSVTDTGTGMSRDTLVRAFEPFFTTKPRGKGTGLGLAMVYGFAKQSGGAARVYSELGHGTTVTLYLPLLDGVMAPASPAIAPKPQAGVGQTVLVVDDEVDLLEIAVSYLEEMGYRVLHATDGVRALETLGREPGVNLVITDILMPGGMNGVELAQRVRARNPEVKIIYSSGFPSDALAQRSGTRLDGPVLYKPYQRAEFTAAVNSAMTSDNGQSEANPSAVT
jgi:PAS domain S-box-containing protein